MRATSFVSNHPDFRRLTSPRSGSITSPECNVDSTDAHTLFLYKFYATHGAFFLVILFLLLLECYQAAFGSGMHDKRHTINTIYAVRDRKYFAPC